MLKSESLWCLSGKFPSCLGSHLCSSSATPTTAPWVPQQMGVQFHHADVLVATLKHTSLMSAASPFYIHVWGQWNNFTFSKDLKNTAGSFTLSHAHCHSGKSRGGGQNSTGGGCYMWKPEVKLMMLFRVQRHYL